MLRMGKTYHNISVCMVHACRNDDTFPRLADPLGYVDKDDIFHAIKAIVATQRDYGRRDDRKQVGLCCISGLVPVAACCTAGVF